MPPSDVHLMFLAVLTRSTPGNTRTTLIVADVHSCTANTEPIALKGAPPLDHRWPLGCLLNTLLTYINCSKVLDPKVLQLFF